MDSNDNGCISIIIPVYNVKNYLRECLDSVLSQTYKNLEIIVVDDGSTDGSSRLCDAYAKKDTRIQVIHQNNQGLSAARNTGLDAANGEFIAFLDSDDYLKKNAMEALLHGLLEFEGDICIGALQEVDVDGKKKRVVDFPITMEYQVVDERTFWKYVEQSYAATVVWTKLYRKELWQNYRFPTGKIHEDEDAVTQIAKLCQKFVFTNKVCISYRKGRQGSIMAEPFCNASLDKADFLLNRLEYFISQQYIEQFNYAFGELSRFLLIAIQAPTYRESAEMRKRVKEIYRKARNV